MTQFMSREKTHLGVFSPKGYLVAIVADLQEAEHALVALREAGFDEVYLYNGKEVIEDYAAWKAHRGPFQRIEWVLSLDEDLNFKEYLRAAERGHNIIMVHAPECEAARPANAILEHYHAYGMRHYGRWTIHEPRGHTCSVDLKAMLELDVQKELQSAADYRRQAEQAESLGAVDLKAKLEAMAAAKTTHANELRELINGWQAQPA